MIHNFCIGGLGLRIKGVRSGVPLMSRHFPLFHVKSAGRGDIEWNFHPLDPVILKRLPLSPEDDPIVSSCLHWGSASPLLQAPAFRKRLSACRERRSRIAVECRPDAVTILDFGRCRGDVFFVELRPGANDGFGDERILGAGLLAPFLPFHGAFMLHAAGIVDSDAGTAALFLAPDEGGKTTAARLSRPGIIIDDDQVVLRRERGGFWVHGTPWGLISAGPIKAKLGGIFLLEKARRFLLTPLKAADAVGFIWDEHRNMTDFIPAEMRKKAFVLITDACSSVPVFRLRFSKDSLDWQTVAGRSGAGNLL